MQFSPQKSLGPFIKFVFVLAIVVTCPSASRLKQQSMQPAHVLAAEQCNTKAEGKEMNRLNGRKEDKQMATSPDFCRRTSPPTTSTTVRRPG